MLRCIRDMFLSILVALCFVFFAYAVAIVLASPAKAGNVDEVGAAWEYIQEVIATAPLVPFTKEPFIAVNGKQFPNGETKVACSLAAKHMYGLLMEQAKEEDENVTVKDAFVSILGTYATCSMAFGWAPDLDAVEVTNDPAL